MQTKRSFLKDSWLKKGFLRHLPRLCGQSLFFEANVASVGVSDPKKKTFDDLEE
jgi:hypothetical protein